MFPFGAFPTTPMFYVLLSYEVHMGTFPEGQHSLSAACEEEKKLDSSGGVFNYQIGFGFFLICKMQILRHSDFEDTHLEFSL